MTNENEKRCHFALVGDITQARATVSSVYDTIGEAMDAQARAGHGSAVYSAQKPLSVGQRIFHCNELVSW